MRIQHANSIGRPADVRCRVGMCCKHGPNSARQSKNGTSDAQSPILGMLRNSKLGFGDFKKEGFFVKNQNRVKKSEEMMPAE